MSKRHLVSLAVGIALVCCLVLLWAQIAHEGAAPIAGRAVAPSPSSWAGKTGVPRRPPLRPLVAESRITAASPPQVTLFEGKRADESAADSATRAQAVIAYRELLWSARLIEVEDARLRDILADAQENWQAAFRAWQDDRDQAVRLVLADAGAAAALAPTLDDNSDVYFERLSREVESAMLATLGPERGPKIHDFLEGRLRDILDTRPFVRAP
ncbi:MAG TPA: hypothetical protein VFH68_22855 [Polyangia bacterium]|jgi:hypothetical protein|nr:hypothetical protein [Polyangia bacterium]